MKKLIKFLNPRSWFQSNETKTTETHEVAFVIPDTNTTHPIVEIFPITTTIETETVQEVAAADLTPVQEPEQVFVEEEIKVIPPKLSVTLKETKPKATRKVKPKKANG